MMGVFHRGSLTRRTPAPGAARKRSAKPGRGLVARLLATAACLLAVRAAPAVGETIDLEKLDGPTAIKMMEEGKLTSVRLTKLYIDRIEALNKRGPGLNAVTQLNEDALKEAAQLDKERAQGHIRGPAHGLPVLLKDL